MNMYDYRLITGSCESGTKNWLDDNNIDYDCEMTIDEFYNKFKNKGLYNFEIFEEFYEDYNREE